MSVRGAIVVFFVAASIGAAEGPPLGPRDPKRLKPGVFLYAAPGLVGGSFTESVVLFVHERLTRVRDVAEKRHEDLEAFDAAYADIHREHPFPAGPDLVAALRRLLGRPEFQSLVHGEEPC